jgi:DNA-binding NarL/FixJ family response regulator
MATAEHREGSAQPTADVAVLGVDDQTIFLDVAREVVAATPGFVWVGSVTSGEAAVAEVDRLEPSLVLLDVRMPGVNGLQTARRITERHPEVVVVLVSMEAAPPAAVAASGAAVLVRKQEFGPATLRRLWQTYASTG